MVFMLTHACDCVFARNLFTFHGVEIQMLFQNTLFMPRRRRISNLGGCNSSVRMRKGDLESSQKAARIS